MRRLNGFTLIELLIAIAIVGILAAVAYPSYTQYQIKANRTDMQSEMLRISNRLQQVKVINHNYKGVSLKSLNTETFFPNSSKPNYELTLTIDDDFQGYILSAIPVSTTRQSNDGIICLNQDGHKFWKKGQNTCRLTDRSTWID